MSTKFVLKFLVIGILFSVLLSCNGGGPTKVMVRNESDSTIVLRVVDHNAKVVYYWDTLVNFHLPMVKFEVPRNSTLEFYLNGKLMMNDYPATQKYLYIDLYNESQDSTTIGYHFKRTNQQIMFQ